MRRTIVPVLLILLLATAGCTPRSLWSREGNVEVTSPRARATVSFAKQDDGSWQATVPLQGKARAFEATVSWEAFILASSSAALTSLGQGSFMASAGAPDFGTFDQTLTLVSTTAPTGGGTLRVFLASPKDGSQTDIVDVALTLQSGS